MYQLPGPNSIVRTSLGHTAAVLDGKKISKQWQSDLQARAADVADRLGRSPGLGVVLVGSRPDSKIYVQRKQEAGTKVASRAHYAAKCTCHALLLLQVVPGSHVSLCMHAHA